MVRLRRSAILGCVVVFAGVLGTRDVLSCFGPMYGPLFTAKEVPWNGPEFARGQLGVLFPSLNTRDMAVAFRVLNGFEVSPADIRTLYPPPPDPHVVNAAPETVSWREWLETRKNVPNVPEITYIDTYSNRGDTYFQNCADDAFRTAEKHLKALAANSQWATERVHTWVTAQDQVFSNCSGRQEAQIPAALSGSGPEQQDREYQIGAALFYAGEYDRAAEQFRKIAADQTSEWHNLAPYLVGRALFREHSDLAAPYLKDLAAKSTDASTRANAQALLEHLEAMHNPPATLAEIGQRIVSNPKAALPRDLDSFVYLWNILTDVPSEPKRALERAQEGDLLDWMYTFKADDPELADAFKPKSERHAFEMWRKTKHPAWLIAALRMNGTGDMLDPLLVAARDVKRNSPAYFSVAFYAAADLETAHRSDEARQWIEQALGADPPLSVRNLLLDARLRIARTWDEFLADSLRHPIAESEDSAAGPEALKYVNEKTHGLALLTKDAAGVLNRDVPLDRLVATVQNPALPPELRHALAAPAWTRAVVLGRVDTARALTPALVQFEPSLASDMKLFSEAAPERAAFVATLIILRNPGLSTDVRYGWGRGFTAYAAEGERINKLDYLRNNWWCGPEPYGYDLTPPTEPKTQFAWDRQPLQTAFLSEQDRKQADTEWNKLDRAAPSLLSERVIAWAERHPEDPLIPEALHLAVRATRYGCTDQENSRFSHRAFDLLHGRYAKSIWAKRTPYWFGN